MSRSIAIIFLLGIGLNVLGQNGYKDYNKEQKDIFLEGESYYQYGDYLSAMEEFKKIEPQSENFPEFNYLMGTSLYKLKRYDEAEPYLEKGKAFSKDALYMLAELDLREMKMKEAREKLQDFEANYDMKTSKIPRNQLERLKGNISTAERMVIYPEAVNVVNLGPRINSENDEYGPLISSDETVLIYTARRLSGENQMDPTGKPFEDIYISYKKEGSDEWQASNRLPGKVNTDKHDAAVGLSPDGERLFIYRSSENLIGGDIYETDLKDSTWTIPIRMSEKINEEETIEPSASLSLDGRTLYFSSNRSRGYGGFDIYRVKMLPDGRWSLPTNLGPEINTEFDDDAPFIHPDGKTLYFSSEGHENMGGFDVFVSEQTGSTWSKPKNLGYPTNTTKDDIYFVISANEQHGYYSSDKEGGFGKQDIYMIDYLEKSLRSSVIRGTLKDTTGNPLAAEVTVIELESGELSGVYLPNPKTGSFIFLVNPNVEYELIIQSSDYPEYSEVFTYSVEDLKKPQRKDFVLE
jgi:tetratricopeptide (TPR) repeat protein